MQARPRPTQGILARPTRDFGARVERRHVDLVRVGSALCPRDTTR